MICGYVAISLLIGLYAELSGGDPFAKVPERIWSVVCTTLFWPFALILSLWGMWTLDDGEDLGGPW